jgi:hypothetical protein
MALIVCVLLSALPARALARIFVSDQYLSLKPIDEAWMRLAAGKPTEAYRLFKRELLRWAPDGPSSMGYVDCERGMMIAAIFARDDEDALQAWRKILGKMPEPPGDALVYAGRWNDAFQAYQNATHDNALINPTSGPDPVVASGIRQALIGNLRGAIREWSMPANTIGPYDLTDVQEALTGIAWARLGNWKNAQTAWLKAARYRRNIPQMAEFETGNVIALSMLYHFRAKLAHGG